jgi:hypothetical protein
VKPTDNGPNNPPNTLTFTTEHIALWHKLRGATMPPDATHIRYQDLTTELFRELFWPKPAPLTFALSFCPICHETFGHAECDRDKAGRLVHADGCLDKANVYLHNLVYFAEGDEERYTCTDPREYVVEVLDDLFPHIPDEFEVRVFRRREVDAEWVRVQAGNLMNQWAEWYQEEYGPWEDPPEHGGDEGELLALLQTWARRADVYACEEMPIRIVLDREAIDEVGREEWPDEWPPVTQ